MKMDFSARQYHAISNSSTSYIIIAKVVQKHDFACLGAELFHVLQLNNVVDTLLSECLLRSLCSLCGLLVLLKPLKKHQLQVRRVHYILYGHEVVT